MPVEFFYVLYWLYCAIFFMSLVSSVGQMNQQLKRELNSLGREKRAENKSILFHAY